MMARAKALLAARSAFTSERTPLDRAVGDRRRRGLAILDLTAGNPTTVDLPGAEALVATLGHPRGASYAPDAIGERATREAVARALGGDLDPDRILITASTSEAYSFAFLAFADAGDEVLVPRPSYPLLDWLARLAGVTLRGYPLRYDGAWHVDLDGLRRAVGPRTRAIVVVSPNNPTGSYLHDDERAAMVALAAEHGLAILADEVFRAYPLGPRRYPSLAGETGAITLAMGGLSKQIGMPQLKLGWTVVSGPDELVPDVMERLSFVADTFLSTATPVQRALPELLAIGRQRTEAIAARTRENLGRLRRTLAGSPASVLDVEGGWYAVVRAPAVLSDDAWALALLDRGVLVQPGHLFDFEEDARLVVSLLPEPAVFAAGTDVLRDAIELISR